MAQGRIVVVDDEEDIRELVRYNLAREGYLVSCAATGEEALEIAKCDLPDLVILDLMLPGLDGLEICRRLKNNEKTNNILIMMLTAKGEEADIVVGLELGADDYVTKPFSTRVLTAKVKAILRRKHSKVVDKNSVIKVHDITIDPGRFEVLVQEKPVQLSLTEFRILQELAGRPGWVFTRDQIIDAVHGDDYPVTDRSIDVQIVGLRKKLGASGKYIETVRGVGYRFME